MYKKNSLIFALGTKVIAVFSLCILLHVFMRNRKKEGRRRRRRRER